MREKIVVDLTKLGEPDYKGSVQELYFLKDNPEWMVCKTMPGGLVKKINSAF